MECEHSEQASALMSLALDDLLDADSQRRLQRHLATCSTCREEWEAMQRASALLEQDPLVGPPLGFAVRVERRLEQKAKKRRRAFGGLAVLTSSVSLAAVTASVVVILVLSFVIWPRLSALPTVQERTGALSQVASGMGLVGKGASLFLGDLLLRYGAPLVLLLGIGLVVLLGLWTWLFVRRPGGHRHNGYA
jgi:anti-sigma factor RsiW